jgi:hypothetical protein
MRRVALACAFAVVLGGCGSDRPALPADCAARPEQVVAALARAPRAVTLAEGTHLSRCVSDADSPSEVQGVGVVLQTAAELLRDRGVGGDARAAVALGYLAGATRKGAAATQGVTTELAVRVGRVAGRLLDERPALRPALRQGLRAGERLG